MERTATGEQGQHSQAHERRERGGERTGAQGERLRALEMERLRAVGRNLGAQLGEQVHKRPYVVIGAAAGLGFVAGSLLGSRLGQMLLAAGIGYVVKNVVEGDIGVERIQERLEELTGERQPA
jgi:ElaB/YqjD/DUF883 family membrane-anchored ribosome-binding protein